MRYSIYRRAIMCPANQLSSLRIEGGGYVAAGYPAEAYNYIEPGLDLNRRIIRNKRHNRCVWATNSQMIGEGIFYGDLVVFDQSLKWKPEAIGVYWLEDGFSLRREVRHPDGLELIGLEPTVKPVFIPADETLERLGIVTHIVKKFSVYRNNYAGVPENAENYVEQGMDYTKYLIPKGHIPVTFYLWTWGESMSGDGIESGDLLIVDNTVEAHEDSILVFIVDRAFTLKRVVRHGDYNELVSSNPAVPPIRIDNGAELERWGVLTGVVKEIYKSGSTKMVRTSGRK